MGIRRVIAGFLAICSMFLAVSSIITLTINDGVDFKTENACLKHIEMAKIATHIVEKKFGLVFSQFYVIVLNSAAILRCFSKKNVTKETYKFTVFSLLCSCFMLFIFGVLFASSGMFPFDETEICIDSMWFNTIHRSVRLIVFCFIVASFSLIFASLMTFDLRSYEQSSQSGNEPISHRNQLLVNDHILPNHVARFTNPVRCSRMNRYQFFSDAHSILPTVPEEDENLEIIWSRSSIEQV
ncbi:hypothetical protein CAEBREN_21388 [Caenorhabditis brenneri]|uniref:Uncharacterized protein n=1 Tax=Caenorhabditis brenneri TaxID=135651 RepID=G0NKX8_CAEBE|nr:hypothetical protein CAEBREN_21388 [Caenorhabditis brenneri]